ncbi:MAG: DUF4102 domain-containing protein [Caulobacteraceae bacterium]|nr:DUF4102 domain-containing protein [Caulobacteraceae bacterium]
MTAAAVKAAAAPAMLHDGGGLYLKAEAAGDGEQRSWLFRYTAPATSKRRWMGLGSAEAVSLKDARAAAEKARQQLEAGIDPIDKRKLERAAAAVEADHARTFKQAALEYVETKRGNGRPTREALVGDPPGVRLSPHRLAPRGCARHLSGGNRLHQDSPETDLDNQAGNGAPREAAPLRPCWSTRALTAIAVRRTIRLAWCELSTSWAKATGR